MNVMPQDAELQSHSGGKRFVDTLGARLRRFTGRTYVAAGAILLTLAVGGGWLYHQFTHVYVTDARIAADMISISSRVPGWVTAVNVIEGDEGASGQVLLQIDDRDSRLALQGLDAQLSGIASRRAEIEARISLTDRQTASAITAQHAAVSAAEAALAATQTQRNLAQTENTRAERLALAPFFPPRT